METKSYGLCTINTELVYGSITVSREYIFFYAQ